MKPLLNQRHLFDIPDDIAYFNCAYYSPQLIASKLKLIEGVGKKSQPWKKLPIHFFEDAEKIRELAGELFGGQKDGFAIVPSASYGLSTAARILEPVLKSGDQILLIDEEFPSNVLIWRRICSETGAVISTIPTPLDGDWTNAILERLNKKTKVLSVSSCHWANGAFINLDQISKACRDLNCILILDATQSLGAMPFSIDEILPDFLVASGYKWLLSPYGFCLFYASEKWRNSRPLEESWQARENSEDFNGLVRYSDIYKPGSRRFDVGEKGTDTILPGAIASLEQIKLWRIQDIANSISLINNQIASHLLKLGFRIPLHSQRTPHILGAVLPETYSGDLVNELRNRNIFISRRGNSLRFAPHLFINDKDIEKLLDALSELIK